MATEWRIHVRSSENGDEIAEAAKQGARGTLF